MAHPDRRHGTSNQDLHSWKEGVALIASIFGTLNPTPQNLALQIYIEYHANMSTVVGSMGVVNCRPYFRQSRRAKTSTVQDIRYLCSTALGVLSIPDSNWSYPEQR